MLPVDGVCSCEAKYQTMPPMPASSRTKLIDAPDDRAAGGSVPDEFFMRPVLRVADVLAGTIGAGCPCRPPEERSHLTLLGGIGESSGRNRICIAAIAVNVSVVGSEFFECGSTIVVDHDRVGRRIVCVMARDFR